MGISSPFKKGVLSTEILKSVTGVMVGDNLVQPGWDYPKVEETPRTILEVGEGHNNS